MNGSLAWRNAVDNKTRTVLATAGISAALLLIFMQVCFYDTGFRSSTLIYDQLDFELILMSPQYVHLRFAGRIPRRCLEQARQCGSVVDAMPLYVGTGDFRQQGRGATYEVLVLGVDAATQPFRVPSLRLNLHRLRVPETAIFDELMIGHGRPTIRAGEILQSKAKYVRIVDTYRHGPGLIADAAMIVGAETMSMIVPGFRASSPSLGLLRLEQGADPVKIAHELQTLLSPNVTVWTREQVEVNDQDFLMRNKPLGYLFFSGVMLGLTVGAVVIHQVLAAAVITASSEYAAMRAIGYSKIQIHGMVMQQALLFVFLALPPATGLAYLVCGILKASTHWPFELTVPIVFFVSFLAVVLSCASGVLVIGKLQRADPADLFN